MNIRKFGQVNGLANQTNGLDIGAGNTDSTIKSRQNGSVLITSASQAITISAVDLTKAVVRIMARSGTTGGSAFHYAVSGELTNTTTLTIALYNTGETVTVSWEVIEFNGVKSLQSGSWQAGATTQTLTVSSVNTAKSMIFYSFASLNGGGGANINEMLTTLEITTSTQLTFKGTGADVWIVKWFLVEFN